MSTTTIQTQTSAPKLRRKFKFTLKERSQHISKTLEYVDKHDPYGSKFVAEDYSPIVSATLPRFQELKEVRGINCSEAEDQFNPNRWSGVEVELY